VHAQHEFNDHVDHKVLVAATSEEKVQNGLKSEFCKLHVAS
jgi:hypothetical protein